MIAMYRVVVPLLILATAAGCSGSNEPAATAPTTDAPSAEEQATAAHQRYWDVYVELSNSGDIDPQAFDGVAEGSFVEGKLKVLGDQAESGVVRVGEPKLTSYTTTVDGDTASSVVCLDERAWGARSGDRDLAPPGDKFPPTAVRATLKVKGDGWIVTDVTASKETSCPA